MISRRKLDSIILKSIEASPWSLSNTILYAMCKEYPSNTEKENVLAKTVIIGRVYSAALERGVGEKKTMGGKFYLNTVYPKISSFFSKSAVKEKLRRFNKSIDYSTAADLHGMFVKALYELRNSNKVSFASKYLHFHYPNQFYIFDSRAKKAIGILNRHFNDGKRFSKKSQSISAKNANSDYLSFVNKCEPLREKLRIELKRNELTIREFDTILINIADSIS